MSNLDQSSQVILRDYIEQATHDAYLNHAADPNQRYDEVFVRIQRSTQAILEAVRTGNLDSVNTLLGESVTFFDESPSRDPQGRYTNDSST